MTANVAKAAAEPTAAPWATSGLRDRGILKEGAFADLTLFDAQTVDEAATYAAPIQPARGIDAVIVNGQLVWRDGRSTGARPGRVLRREDVADA